MPRSSSSSSSTIVPAAGAAGSPTSAKGWFFPRNVPSRLLRQFETSYNYLFDTTPYVHPRLFNNPNRVELHSAYVVVGTYTYYIVGFHDLDLDINPNLLEFAPNTLWRGEIALFSVGKHIHFLAKPIGCKRIHRIAITLYMSRMMESYTLPIPFPLHMTCGTITRDS